MQKKSLTFIAAAACIAAILLAGCASPAAGPGITPTPATPTPVPTQPPVAQVTFGQPDNGGTYSVARGAEVSIRLPENPTTGFLWNLSVPTGLTIINDTYIPDDPTGKLVGSGGTRVWFLRADLAGSQEISAVYHRPWEPAGQDVTLYGLTLVVEENVCGVSACAVTTPPATVPPRYHVYTDADSGKTVTEALGETFAVRLAENPSTGYSWNLSLPSGLTLSRDEFIPASTGGQAVGAGGTRSFTLVAAEKGTWNLSAEYRRPWLTSGTVVYQDLEGGFYGIVGDDGKQYDPLNLDAKFRKDGLRVAFDATAVQGIATTHMWGTPVNLSDVDEIPGFSLSVLVG
ncbi:MAG TPA: protease inhibitor I42 family protein [Methanomicrobiales archaeon]|nr:protease inhibitor I42 family protein [Methanomicrobiales archaeon]